MSGTKSKKGLHKLKQTGGKETEEQDRDSEPESGSGLSDAAKAMQDVSKQINELKLELKQCLSEFRDEVRLDVKTELDGLKNDILQKLQETNEEVQSQGARLTETERRVQELETANAELMEMVVAETDRMETLQAKVTDLEGRSRRNNIRIYGVKEGLEGSSMISFVEDLLKTQLDLGGVDLQLQRAHRSLAFKPQNEEAPPRSIIVNFLQFSVKELVLKAAWAKELKLQGKRVSFSQDYPTEVMAKRREYVEIKKVLKEHNIRFQTPYPARLRIQWESGTKLYHTAAEARTAMEEMGMTVPTSHTATQVQTRTEKSTRDPHWRLVSKKSRMDSVREKLQGFRRQQSSSK